METPTITLRPATRADIPQILVYNKLDQLGDARFERRQA